MNSLAALSTLTKWYNLHLYWECGSWAEFSGKHWVLPQCPGYGLWLALDWEALHRGERVSFPFPFLTPGFRTSRVCPLGYTGRERRGEGQGRPSCNPAEALTVNLVCELAWSVVLRCLANIPLWGCLDEINLSTGGLRWASSSQLKARIEQKTHLSPK